MDWIERNLDAYKILAEILNDLRVELRRELEKTHGADWCKTGLPSDVFDRLVSSKEGSTAIDWYETEYQQIMDFAVFPDFCEIIEHNADHLPALLEVVPSRALFQARFLELEVLRSKVGRARPISEGESAFLKTFHKRFLKHLAIHRDGVTPEASTEHNNEVESEEVSIPIDEPGMAAKQESEPSEPEKERPSTQVTPPADAKPPQRSATAGAHTTPKVPEEENDPQPPPENTDENNGVNGTVTGSLTFIVSSGNSTAILRELFKEVTALAESLWSSDVPPAQTVWREVRVSSWYEENFTGLGLKPLSDFYEVISHVDDKLSTGGLAKHELQKMLEEANFAHILLALRDMFQKNRI